MILLQITYLSLNYGFNINHYFFIKNYISLHIFQKYYFQKYNIFKIKSSKKIKKKFQNLTQKNLY